MKLFAKGEKIWHFFWSFAMFHALLIFLVLCVGIVVGWLLHGYFVHRRNILEGKAVKV